MITEDYVSFEVAKLLKEKGFDIPCEYFYVDGKLVKSHGYDCNWNEGESLYTDYKNECSAPTLQMVMKWLREVHDTYIKVSPDINDSYNFYCDVYTKGSESWDNQNVELGDFSTYEQAADAAIKYCLNLI